MNICTYVYQMGINKGTQCKSKPRDGSDKCCKHKDHIMVLKRKAFEDYKSDPKNAMKIKKSRRIQRVKFYIKECEHRNDVEAVERFKKELESLLNKN